STSYWRSPRFAGWIFRNIGRSLGVSRSRFEDYFSNLLKEMCRRNKKVCSKQTILYIGGSKSISRKRHKIFLETGRKICHGKMYIKAYKKKDGAFVTDEARDIAKQIELVMTQDEKNGSGPSINDAIDK
ncbi:hypothetical protein HN51_055751, partial [Arachis hypogaea]